MTDEGLVLLVQNGNIEEYGKIVDRYKNKIARYVGCLINQPIEEVEDITQEIFIKTYENIQDFDRTKKFSSWIYRIAHNSCIDFFKKKKIKIQLRIDNEDYFESNEKLVEDLEIQSEEKRAMKRAINKLDNNYREAILLYYYEDKSYGEIADILKTNKSNVGVLLKRAKEKLKHVYIKK